MIMKAVHLLVVIFGLTLFVSCTRCSDCVRDGATEQVCEQDFDDPDLYNQTIDGYEADGFECVSTL